MIPPACMLALDSLIDARSLAWLDGQMRVEDERSRLTVCMPGEAACFVNRESKAA